MIAFLSSKRSKLRRGNGLLGVLRHLAKLSKASAETVMLCVGQEVAIRVSFRNREVKPKEWAELNCGLWRRGRSVL